MENQKEIPKAYDPQSVEKNIYKQWEESGYFNPDNLPGERKEVFSVMMPPVNVTGELHLGHAFEHTLMDVEVRYQRMAGKKALLIPGTDHAAVATQAKVEKNLIKSDQYKNPRQELGREKLLAVIKEYADQSQKTILKQTKKLGTSADWSRLAYTFDKERSRAVNEMFEMMYKDDLIYQGFRVINWSVKGQSTCSDDEIEHKKRSGKLYTFKYAKDFPITIATTRPETKLGDTAIAVNPSDKKYKEYIGQTFSVDVGAQKPLKLKIIADEGVDPEFGTGALGVTPAHSATDFDLYEQRLGTDEEIELIQIIDKFGKMTEAAGKNYAGLKVKEAREKFVAWLDKENLLIDTIDIEQNVGTSDRFGDIVESLPMEQWFIAVNKKIPGRNKSFKNLMREAVTTGHKGISEQKVNIEPKHFEKIYLHWIDNLRDWCISRQIWWGHRIPVYKNKTLEPNKPEQIHVGNQPPKWDNAQDPDTLDTWFSSALWTFSTLGWPDKTNDLKEYHPNTWMQMGHEILFFWMARMILMSTYALDEIPFKDVYIHGLLRDKDGRKFSKSLDNGIDPLDVLEQYGTDALRLALLTGVGTGADSRFSYEKVKSQKHLVNKIWNISRFIKMVLGEEKPSFNSSNIKPQTLTDKWILSRLHQTIKEVTKDLDNYRFSQAIENLCEFVWHELADWYLEIAKHEGNKQNLLVYLLSNILKLFHPFIPFVTEHIWSMLWSERNEVESKTNPSTSSGDNIGMLIIQPWPQADQKLIESDIEKEFSELQEIITKIRNWKAENKIAFKEIKDIKIDKVFSEDKVALIKHLTNVTISDTGTTI